MKKGKLFGVGVGPGDPELMTLKSVRVIEESSVIAVPGEAPENSVAYRIALRVCPCLLKKETVALPMPMTKKGRGFKGKPQAGGRDSLRIFRPGKTGIVSHFGGSQYLFHLPVCEKNIGGTGI